ncbi:MAG: helix-turn-helix transcriptional regulator [Selenomonadaceae bacterium]|nr:helix-turn-helix transcriptional regulator [Selenomonadaceae bacterium]
MTQGTLAKMTNLSRSHIAAIEADAYNPSLLTLQSIAEVLRVPVSALIDETFLNLNENINMSSDLLEVIKGFNNLDFNSRQRLLGYLDGLLETSNAKK